MSASLTAILATSLALAAVGTPVARRAALRLDLVDRPAARKLHLRPTPLLGGVALWAAVLGSLLLYPERRQLVAQCAGILVGATWISLWGLVDDRRGMRPSVKLLVQLPAVALLVVAGVQVGLPLPAALNLLLTLGWVLVVTNAFNLLDNMDGLAGGVGAVAAASFLVLAALNGQYLVGGLAAAVCGACLGFLLHNFNPARIFMGDSGSLFLGFVLAALAIKLRFPGGDEAVTWLIPSLALGVPLVDTATVVVTRLRAGKNPVNSPGRDHLSHRLLRRGWNCGKVVVALWSAGAVLARRRSSSAARRPRWPMESPCS